MYDLRKINQVALVVIVTIIAFDFVAYLVMPVLIPLHFPGNLFAEYHRPSDQLQVLGRGAYPQNYFVSNDERGFDIGKGKSANHIVKDHGSYKIWSNSLGCFDANEPNKLTSRDFIYLAGDSFTWGYTPYENKFGTLLELKLNLPVLKCGVTHSGQRHQFAKFKEITESLARYPSVVVINYVDNDVKNDYAYPHSTVVEGWLVDTVMLDENNEIVSIDVEPLRNEIKKSMAIQGGLKAYARAYSLSYNILSEVYHKAKPAASDVWRERETGLKNIYYLNLGSSGMYSYDNQYAQPNKEVLALWHAHAKQHNYLLIVSLIPPRTNVSKDYYSELEQFLRKEEIPFVNFSDYISQNKLTPDDIYWTYDGHFNINGNRKYANFLSSVIQEALLGKRP